MLLSKLKRIFLGKNRDPLSSETRKKVAMVAFFAWVGLGADGLSSSCYGPEQAFVALGQHYHLALYLTLAISLTVFLIATSYNQVIQLFPNGGGGYKVATRLLGPYSGLIAGITLVMDYVLTVAISISAGVHAIFSSLPGHYIHWMIPIEVVVLLFLMYLNIRGAKESVKFLLPVFLGFLITHIAIIILGIVWHENQLPAVVHATIADTKESMHLLGLTTVVALFLKAYSLGGSTYTGLEAVSNNVNILAEPRVKTGKWTMVYMAVSLSFVASGIVLLYLLWHVVPVPGETLNAVVFGDILAKWHYGHVALVVLMAFEAGLLLIGANTGFLGGPQVMANMSLNNWVPRLFSALSNRLVVQNGTLFIGGLALITLLLTGGNITLLAVLYSMNVFLTFSLSLFGLIVYWSTHRAENRWWAKLIWSSLAFLVCAGIFFVTLFARIEQGGWLTLILLAAGAALCISIKRHYHRSTLMRRKLDKELELPLKKTEGRKPRINKKSPTAVLLVKSIGGAMHTMLWIERMFPKHFKNYIFISHGEVDIGSFGSEESLTIMQEQLGKRLNYMAKFANQNGMAADIMQSCGTDSVESLSKDCKKISEIYSDPVFFAPKYIYSNETFITRLLHGDFTAMLQRRLQNFGAKMLVIPITMKSKA